MARYGKKAQESVKEAMHKYKLGELHSGKGGKAGKAKSREQAIAIGLSEARKKGAKVPQKASSKSTGSTSSKSTRSSSKSTRNKSTRSRSAVARSRARSRSR